jgi:branched-chain amino acid transport system permease protein
MELFAQLLVNSVVVGSSVTLVALGFSLILTVTGTLHFAHGAVYAASAYVVYFISSVLGAPVPLGLASALAVGLAIGVGSELVVYRPLRDIGVAPRMLLVGSLALLILIQNVLSLLFGSDVKTLAVGYRPEIYHVGPVVLTSTRLVVVGVAIVLAGLLAVAVYRTEIGLRLRALASNPLLAEMSGINRRRAFLLTFALGSALAAPAGVLAAFDAGLTPTLGVSVTLLAVTAVIIGGVGSFVGAIVGSYLVAAALNLGIYYIGSEWQTSIAFALMMVFIFFRPRGLFGRRQLGFQI